MKYLYLFACLILCAMVNAQSAFTEIIQSAAKEIEQEVIEWRRHCHQYPELSNREFKTAEYISKELDKMGIPNEKGMAFTGVIGTIKGALPGPTVGLRADIDGLPVVERVELPFASKEKTTYLNEEVGIMHACGHDAHVAMLLGTAKILKSMQKQLKGNIVLVFQPAEEGAPPGEEGGAKLMVKEGIFDKYPMDVIFGQHISSGIKAGNIHYRVGGTMAASDRFVITVHGKQTHGSRPWDGVDPIVTAAHIILGLQSIISRQTELTKEAAVISVGKITSGVRNNIIPESAELIGTIRTLDTDMQKIIHEKIKHVATRIAESMGAKADVDITIGYPVTYNDPDLTRKMINTLYAAAGEDQVRVVPARTGAEDFSFFAQQVPGMYYFVGGRPASVSKEDASLHHTPDFYLDESGFITGVKAMTLLALDYMEQYKKN